MNEPAAAARPPAEEGIARRLRGTLRSGRLPHAYLFVGTSGTGRLEAARWLAGVLLCTDRPAPDTACGECQSCRLMRDDCHPDYHTVGVPEGRQQLPIVAIRQVQHVAGLKPSLADRRVFVIRETDRMSLEAANCFLKTLEEPPGRCLFVLIAAGLRRLPETVVSRSRIVRFGNLAPDVLADRLVGEGMDADQARWLARRSWGSPGLARELQAMGLPEFNSELTERLDGLSPEQDFALSDWLGERAREGAESAARSRIALQEMLECALLHYRDLAERASPPAAERLLEQAELVLEAIEGIGENANRQLALDRLFTELARRQAPAR